MNQAFIIAKKDMRETFHTRAVYFYLILLCFLSLPYFDGVRSVVNALSEQSLPPGDLSADIQSLLNMVFGTLPLVLTMISCSVFSAYSVTMEKVKHTLESLLATPLNLKQIWLGKSLAVALPSIAIGLLISLLSLLAMNLLIIADAVGGFIMPDAWSLVASLVIMPIMAFFLVAIVSLIQLIIANPRIANFAFIAIFLGIYISTVTELTGSWNFILIYLAAAVALAAIVFGLSRRFLTKERVVLSSKGG